MIEAKLPRAELIDTAMREVWQTLAPITREQYDALDTPEGWHRVGLGSGAKDEHWFRRRLGSKPPGDLSLRRLSGVARGLIRLIRPAVRD